MYRIACVCASESGYSSAATLANPIMPREALIYSSLQHSIVHKSMAYDSARAKKTNKSARS